MFHRHDTVEGRHAPATDNNDPPAALQSNTAAGVILTGLIYGADFLIPIVVALIVVKVLEAIIERLQKVGLPAVLAVPSAIVFMLIALTAVILFFIRQIDALIAPWPRYLERRQTIAADLLSGLGDEWIARLQTQLNALGRTNHISAALGPASGTVLMF